MADLITDGSGTPDNPFVINGPIPDLNLMNAPTFDSKLLAIIDISKYPSGFNIVSPTLSIVIPGYPEKQFLFTPQTLNVYNSYTLKISCSAENCTLVDLPDGIYIVKYAINPAYKYNVTKTFLRVDQLYQKFDEHFLSLELFTCDGQLKRNKQMILDDAEFYIQGAIAAANRCSNNLAIELYKKASKLLDKLN